MIPFNKPHIVGQEFLHMSEAISSGKLSGNGKFTQRCQSFFSQRFGFGSCLLTTSCTDALEMAAILIGIEPGDEVIVPSFTFVSTANAFVLRGAKIVFIDSRDDHPGMNEDLIESLITPRTKAIVPVHYAGIACDMDKIMDIANRHALYVIEDAAQAIDSYYTDKNGCRKALGSIGHLAAFSFHETKNIISGEGGLLVINDSKFKDRAEIIWEKGTNRASFFRGEVDKYGWVDLGSSFLPSEIMAAFLWAQIERFQEIQERRLNRWNRYKELLLDWAVENDIELPLIPSYATNNAHMFFLVCKSINQRSFLISELKKLNIMSAFHYQSLHLSSYYEHKHDGRTLNNSDKYSNCLLRLPLFFDLKSHEIDYICDALKRLSL